MVQGIKKAALKDGRDGFHITSTNNHRTACNKHCGNHADSNYASKQVE